MEPINREAFFKRYPNADPKELDEYEQLLGKRFGATGLSSEEELRIIYLFGKLWPDLEVL
jgi:hypothetical protein